MWALDRSKKQHKIADPMRTRSMSKRYQSFNKKKVHRVTTDIMEFLPTTETIDKRKMLIFLFFWKVFCSLQKIFIRKLLMAENESSVKLFKAETHTCSSF